MTNITILKKWGFILFLTALCLSCGCKYATKSKPITITSVPMLIKALQNFETFDIVSCNYMASVEPNPNISQPILVPSPSDTIPQVVGQCEFSEKGFKEFKSKFEWQAISKQDIPKTLKEILPDGNFLFSKNLNESFETNSGYMVGYVVILVDDNSNRIFFFSQKLR